MVDNKRFAISVEEAYQARKVVSRYIPRTGLICYEALSQAVGAHVFVKHENHTPIGSFKIRGGLNLVDHLIPTGVRGVITYSTGNHGISIATAARWLGIPAVVVLPESANPVKKQAIRGCGAELVEAGATFEDCALVVEQLSRERGFYFAHPCDEPLIIDGVGTLFLEILEELPQIDVMIVPLGGGSEAAAACAILRALKPSVEIIAVQAEQSPAAYNSWRAGRICEAPNRTFAGGVATGKAYETPFRIYKDVLSDFVLLSEDEIYEGIGLAAHYTHNFTEGAGAMPLMTAFKLRERLRGKNVVLQMSGCNASPQEFREAARRPSFEQGWMG